MWNPDFTEIRNRITLLVVQFFVLLFCAGYVIYIYTDDIHPDKQAKTDFVQTTCLVVSKKLNMHEHLFGMQYRADFLISYNVDGTQYNRWVSGNGLRSDFSSGRVGKENILAQFDEGGTYTCWYDPTNPQVAVIVMRHSWSSTLPLMIPAVISIILLYYFFQTLFGLIRDLIARSREEL